MSYKPRDLFPSTLKVAKAFFRSYDQVEEGKKEARARLCEEFGVPEQEAFRWVYVVRPYFEDQDDPWPFYDDLEERALDLSEYEDESRVDASVLAYSGPADQPEGPIEESPLKGEADEKDSSEDTVTVEGRNKMAGLIGADPATVWRAVDQHRPAKGYPVHEWVVLDEKGHIDRFEVPVGADPVGAGEQDGSSWDGTTDEPSTQPTIDDQDSSPSFQIGDPVKIAPDSEYRQLSGPGEVVDVDRDAGQIRVQSPEGITPWMDKHHFVPAENEWASEEFADEADEEEEESVYEAWQRELSDIERGEDPDPSDLTSREQYIATKLQKGHTIEGLVDDLGTRPSVVKRHLKDLKSQGWSIYFDSSSETVAIEGDNVLRSSEHKGTRTRKANRWWEMRHNELVREYRGIEVPNAGLDSTPGREDWVTHLTDLHAGDKVRREDGEVIYETEDIPDVVDYITDQSLSLARRHNAAYDDAHVLWGGDMITGEAIYQGQFEDLDAWLDEQVDVLVSPLIRQIKAFSNADEFDTVQIVCVVGNHGQNRANGTSRQANADLILYKFIRNAVAELNEHAGILDNVRFRIGQAEAFRNFQMRGGNLRGHLRHGQHRKPQAETSARKKEWQSTYIDHQFDIGYMGHYHVTGRIPWNGPPIISTGSPKPSGEFVERLGEKDPEGDYQNVATVHGVSDEGLTCVYPVDTRNYTST